MVVHLPVPEKGSITQRIYEGDIYDNCFVPASCETCKMIIQI